MCSPHEPNHYAELVCTSNFTFLNGASHPQELVARAAELGYKAIALTDECSLAGIVRAFEEAQRCRQRGQNIELISGSLFRLENGSRLVLLALSREEIGDGYALMCQAEPIDNLVIRAREIEAVRDIHIRKMPARVIEKTLLAPDVMRIKIKLPNAQRLQFLAGQYLEIILPEGKRRAFSIASPPQCEDEIELHIRHVEGGGFTGWVFDELNEGDILRLEAPLGTFFIRNDKPERPMILMGGGTGFARSQ